MVKRVSYPSDLTDKQWVEVEPLIPAAEPGGREREVNMREVLNGNQTDKLWDDNGSVADTTNSGF